MEFRQLHTFRLVARTRSFTKAAALANYTQSTVSAQIKALEESLGVTLFDRLGREVSLTMAGKAFCRYAEKLLELADEAREVVAGQGEPAGILTISAPESLCTYRLPDILHLFRRKYPQVEIFISQEYDRTRLSEALHRGEVDLGFLMSSPYQAPGLRVEQLLREAMVIAARPHHPLAGRRSVSLEDLREETFIFTEPTCSYRALFEQALRAANVHPKNAIEFHSIEAIKKCVLSGVGIAFLPWIAVQRELAGKQLVALKWHDQELEVVTQMVCHKDKWLAPAMGAFMDMARNTLRD
jgi:DNA-binding transcriptional LysR family regulator